MFLPAASQLRGAFHENGFALVRGMIDSEASAALAALAQQLLARRGVHIVRRSGDDTLDYRVVTGDVIQREAPPLWNLFASADLLAWIRDVTDAGEVTRSPHLRSAVNVNCLDTAGQGYPWHTDAVPFTGLLFLTTLPESAGGEFLVRRNPGGSASRNPPYTDPGGSATRNPPYTDAASRNPPHDAGVVAIRPVNGEFLLMDGARCAHAVAPLRENTLRLSVPMVFPAAPSARPDGLDDFLYSPGS